MSQCKECTKTGDVPQKEWAEQRSKTTAYTPEYYDAERKLHVHDTNIETAKWRCSNGHIWVTRQRPGKCHCGWTAMDDMVPTVGDPLGKLKPAK